ncbi:MAG TPA: aminotransferase class I/II-fold pyridoxal phosphate-dependent enzyme [Terriglobia bacterium]|nr:aminotransferase class I/II-fold pyridoxal phosphate-dependent enzyme [Terriglobia bacterium]
MAVAREISRVRDVLAATRLEHVRYAIRDIAVAAEQLARQGKEILPLNIGDPLQFDFRTPPHLIEAVVRAMRDGKDGYAPSQGIPEALEAIRAEAGRKGIASLESVFVTQGVSEAVDLCLTALVNPGENVLTPRPEYPLYSAVLAKLEAEPNAYALDEESGWEPDLEDLAARVNPRTRAIVVINPNNPTGAVYSRATLQAIADLARRHGLVVFADEIYDKLILDGEPHVSLAALAPDVPVVTFGGLSKAYLAPGWRVGWGVVSGDGAAVKPYVEGIHKLLRARLSANHPEQYAIGPALEGPQDHLIGVVRKLRARRDLTVEWCRSTPRVSCAAPRGAFYAFPRLEITGGDEEFVRQLLVSTGVLVVHGSGFGQAPGTRHFRIVFLPEEPALGRAYEAIGGFLETWGRG